MALDVRDGLGIAATVKSRLDGLDQVVAHDSIPLATADPIWLVAQPMNVDTDYASVDCQRFSTIWMEFIMAITAEGTLFIEWSMDDSTFYKFEIDAGKFSKIDPDTKLTVNASLGSVTVLTLISESRFSLGIEKPPPFLRARWDFTAGSATGMDAKNFGRA